jgi:hypothetical protein
MTHNRVLIIITFTIMITIITISIITISIITISIITITITAEHNGHRRPHNTR